MTTFHWYTFQNADCDSFNVYRSICGFTINFPNHIVKGSILKFSATSVDIQYITMPSGDIDEILAEINAKGRGVRATKTASGTSLLIRCRADQGAKIKLMGDSTFLNQASLTARTVVPKLEWQIIGTVPRISGQTDYSFPDPDGDALDYYRITTVVGGVESIPSVAIRPIVEPQDMCVLEGRVVDSQAMPAPSAKIMASLRVQGQTADEFISTDVSTAITDEFGRFSLPVLRNQQYLLQIPAVSYNEVITTPDTPTARLIDLMPTKQGRFSPEGDPQ